MSEQVVCGIDVGSSAVKVTVLDPEQGILGIGDAAAPLGSPRPGWSEVGIADWWTAVCHAIPAALAAAGVDASSVAGIAATGMVPAVVVFDDVGRPLRAGILQNDARAVAEIADLAEELSAIDLLTRTGSALTQQSVAPTLLWLQRHEPEIWKHVASVGGSYDWLLRALGAEPHVEDNWAIESGLFDLGGDVCSEVLTAARIDATVLPPVRRPGTVVGALSTAAADLTGLKAGTPLIVGGADHVMSAYSAGVAAPGQALVKLGSSGDLLAASATPLTDWRLYLDRHPIPGLWLPNGCMATSGSLLRWFQQQLAAGSDFRDLDAAAAAVPAGSDGVVCLPYFLGEKSPIHDPEARGAFVGLHLGHTQAHLFRACLEGTGHGLRHHLEILRELGVEVREVRVTNGGANSRLWKRVVADALDLPLQPVIDHPGGSLGAAVVAAVGVGLLERWTDVDRFVRLGEPVEPDASAHAAMELGYGVYRELEAALRPLSHQLARG